MATTEVTTHAFRVLNSDGSTFGKGSFTYEGPSTGVNIAYTAGAAAGQGPKLTAFSYRDPVVGTLDLSNVLTLEFANGEGTAPRFSINLGDPPRYARNLVAGAASPGRHGDVTVHRGVAGALCCHGKKLEFPGGLSVNPDFKASVPAVDLVVVIDTSSSMVDEAETLSKTISGAVAAAQSSCPSDLRVSYLGIEGTFKNTRFDNTVRSYLTSKVNVDPTALRGRTAENAGNKDVDPYSYKEDGARAIEDVARHFDWRPGAARAIFFLGDEPLEAGLGATGTGQDDEDIEAANRAIEAAKQAGVRVHMYQGTAKLSDRSLKAIAGEFARVARETDGQFFPTQEGLSAFQAMLERVICASNPRGHLFDGATTPWLYDIGKGIGKYELDGAALTFKATGTPFRNDSTDHFSYLAVPLLGDGAITVRVTRLEKNADSTVGVQIRETLDADARFVMSHWEADRNLHQAWRETAGAGAKWTWSKAGVDLPLWLRIERKGNEFIGSFSRDEKGEKFEEYYRITVAMAPRVYIGVAATSNEKESAIAALEQVSVTRPQGSDEPPSVPLEQWFGAPGVPHLYDIGKGVGRWEWDGDKITFKAAGTHLWGVTQDDCSFLAAPLTGDGELTVRLLSLDEPSTEARVGIMMRDALDPGARYAMLAWETDEIVFHYRNNEEVSSSYPYAGVPRLPSGATLPLWLRLTRKGDEFSCFYSTDGASFTLLATTVVEAGPARKTIPMHRTTYAGIVVASHANKAATAVLDQYSLKPTQDTSTSASPVSLGSFFEGKEAPKLYDIGRGLGKLERDGDRIRFKASGTQLWHVAVDDFSFLALPFTGDGQLTIRVLNLENTDGDARVGVMIRQSLDVGSPYVMTAYEPTHTLFHFRAKEKTATPHHLVGSPKTPVWVRVVRAGSTITGLYSTDGKAFQVLGRPEKVELNGQVYLGIALSSNAMKANVALIDQCSLVTGTVSDPTR
ncbi:hypothetical protein [Sorangium sp. So ce131]|uniref:hypothetical protein n=1 Tax=Sorangium sp. So ce131 TaxID=3133282 RepID=UPI003F61D537